MSIPIPLILALLAQKNMNILSPKNTSAIVPTQNTQSVNISRTQNAQSMARKLSGAAQLIGGSQGAKLSSAAKMMTAFNGINSPINVLSLIAKSRMNNNAGNILNTASPPNIKGASNIYDNINSMLSNMDQSKKDELMSMAKSIMKRSQ